MKKSEFITPDRARQQYDRIVPTYQTAFAGEPWFEVSKCGGCEREYSAQSPGEVCGRCGEMLEEVAYPSEALVERFEQLVGTRAVQWYVESDEEIAQMNLVALAWESNPDQIAAEKYNRNPAMRDYLRQNLSARAIWLDEVFANRIVSFRGNLDNFAGMIDGMFERLEGDMLVYRTIVPAMLRVPFRDLPNRSTALNDIPDARQIISITR